MSAAAVAPVLLHPFVKTEKQIEACHQMVDHMHTMLYGGSRSAKTTIAVRQVILRATKKPSRHLIVRYRFNHAKVSLWHDTIPKVLRMCFPGMSYQENKADWFITVPCTGGGQSEIWIGGCDDKDRVEKILGTEFSSIFLNECSQITHDAVLMLRTRLAENAGLSLRMYYDCNPPSRTHWTYRVFMEGLMPDKEQHDLDTACMQMNPRDNAENLPPEYLQELQRLPKRQRQRFWDGLFLIDVEGALWTDTMVNEAKLREHGEPVRTVVAVDPAVTNNEGSDACGLVVCSLDADGVGIVHEDLTKKCSTLEWALRAVSAYFRWEANLIIYETNQGGDLIRDAIRNIDPKIKLEGVRASKGKLARAEPVSMLYENGQVAHDCTMIDLEDQMTTFIPTSSTESPNNLDALVWGLTHLMIGPGEPELYIG